jgi:nicotinamidase-related amidase
MAAFADKLAKYVDRSNGFTKKLDLRRTALHALDIQNLCLHPDGADYIESVGGAPSGAETLGPAKRILGLARENGMKVTWSMWGMRPDGADLGVFKFKYPDWKNPDSPFNHGTWNGALCDGFEPLEGEPVMKKHRNSSFYGTAFNEYLTEDNAEYLVIIGSSTANCVPTTARDGFDRGFKVIVIADAGTAIPLNARGRNREEDKNTPEGYGQYWESLRNIQAQYAEVMSSDEFVALVEHSSK